MIRIGFGLKRELSSLSPDDGAVRKMLRAKQVERIFRESVVEIYREHALIVLNEINGVYILREGEREYALPDADAPHDAGRNAGAASATAGAAGAGKRTGAGSVSEKGTGKGGFLGGEDSLPKHLIVYAVDSTVRASLTERREYLLAALARRGEDIGKFTVKISRFNMKKRHPYTVEDTPEMRELEQRQRERAIRRTPLSPEQEKRVRSCGAAIEDERLREAFCKAMESDFKTRNCDFGKK